MIDPEEEVVQKKKPVKRVVVEEPSRMVDPEEEEEKEKKPQTKLLTIHKAVIKETKDADKAAEFDKMKDDLEGVGRIIDLLSSSGIDNEYASVRKALTALRNKKNKDALKLKELAGEQPAASYIAKMYKKLSP
jgi:hypothetical protein